VLPVTFLAWINNDLMIIFDVGPGRFGGPIDPSNYRKRVPHKLADELDLPKLAFQVIRRTIATLGKSKDTLRIFRASCALQSFDNY